MHTNILTILLAEFDRIDTESVSDVFCLNIAYSATETHELTDACLIEQYLLNRYVPDMVHNFERMVSFDFGPILIVFVSGSFNYLRLHFVNHSGTQTLARMVKRAVFNGIGQMDPKLEEVFPWLIQVLAVYVLFD